MSNVAAPAWEDFLGLPQVPLNPHTGKPPTQVRRALRKSLLLGTLGELGFIHGRVRSDLTGEVYSCGGATLAVLHSPDNTLHFGLGICSLRENFNKKVGREAATGRILTQGEGKYYSIGPGDWAKAGVSARHVAKALEDSFQAIVQVSFEEAYDNWVNGEGHGTGPALGDALADQFFTFCHHVIVDEVMQLAQQRSTSPTTNP